MTAVELVNGRSSLRMLNRREREEKNNVGGRATMRDKLKLCKEDFRRRMNRKMQMMQGNARGRFFSFFWRPIGGLVCQTAKCLTDVREYEVGEC